MRIGIKKLENFEQVLLGEWRWRFVSKRDRWWRHMGVIKEVGPLSRFA
ncbi:hypothetical protein CsSME_00047584 [Camellia sinensis var. sinensis]